MLVLLVVILISYTLTVITTKILISLGFTSLILQVLCGMFWGFATPSLLLPGLVKWYYTKDNKEE